MIISLFLAKARTVPHTPPQSSRMPFAGYGGESKMSDLRFSSFLVSSQDPLVRGQEIMNNRILSISSESPLQSVQCKPRCRETHIHDQEANQPGSGPSVSARKKDGEQIGTGEVCFDAICQARVFNTRLY